MLTKTEQAQIRQILQSPQWKTVELLIGKLIEKHKDSYGARESEWETTRNNLINEGKIRGLTELTQEIYNQLNDQRGA